MTGQCLDTASSLPDHGIEVQVIDVCNLWPWDRETVNLSPRAENELKVTSEQIANKARAMGI